MICVDCDRELVIEADYCHQCGARVVRKRLTFRALFSDLLQRVTNLDRGLWPTFKQLTLQPGTVIKGYIQGVRKRFTPPATYALVIGTLYGVVAIVDPELYWHEQFLAGISSDSEPLLSEALLEGIRPYRLPLLFFPVIVISLINKLFYWRQLNWAEQSVVGLYYYAHYMLFYLVASVVLKALANLYPEDPGFGVQLLIVLPLALVPIMYKVITYGQVYRHRMKIGRYLKPIAAFLAGIIFNLIPYILLIVYLLD